MPSSGPGDTSSSSLEREDDRKVSNPLGSLVDPVAGDRKGEGPVPT